MVLLLVKIAKMVRYFGGGKGIKDSAQVMLRARVIGVVVK